MNSWLTLALAISFEVAGTTFLKMSDGFSGPLWGVFSIMCYWVSFAALAYAFKTIPVGVAYAIWSGIGVVLITIIGWYLFKQNLSLVQYVFIGLILIGAIGLNLTTSDAASA